MRKNEQDVDIRTIDMTQAKRCITAAFRVKRPVFISGPSGIGKSMLIEEIANDNNASGFSTKLIDVRVAQMDPTDIRGMPHLNQDHSKMIWAPPIDFPDEAMSQEYDNIILFLDEMNSAPPAVQATAYQLILNRRVGAYKLPDNVVIVAAGNRESDKGVVYHMPSPLANRFVHLNVKPDLKSWFDWAVQKGIHADIVGYIAFAEQDLFNFDPKSSSKAFASPRTWEFVNDFLNSPEPISDTDLTSLIIGCVGEGIGNKFMAHREHAKNMPNPSDILEGKVKEIKFQKNQISVQYTVIVGMCYKLNAFYKEISEKGLDLLGESKEEKLASKKWYEMGDNCYNFLMDHCNKEMAIMGGRMMIVQYDLPFDATKLSSFKKYRKNYIKYIDEAL